MSYLENLKDDSLRSNFLVKLTGFMQIPAKYINKNGSIFSANLDVDNVESCLTGRLSNTAISASRETLFQTIPSEIPGGSFATEASSSSVGIGEYFYDRDNKVIYVGQSDNTSTDPNGNPVLINQINLFYNLYLSVEPAYTYSSPLDDSSNLTQWTPNILNVPTISRDISDFLVGFYPVQTSNLDVASTDRIRKLIQFSHFQNQDFEFYHIVGDPLDTTNVRLVFKGKISDVQYTNERTTFSFNDGSQRFNRQAEHPNVAQDYAEFDGSGTYRVLDSEAGYSRRKIYGVINGLKSLNIDRPANPDSPTSSENRIWAFGIYSGDVDNIEDYEITEIDNSDQEIDIRYNFSALGAPDDRFTIEIEARVGGATTDDEKVDIWSNFHISENDFVKITNTSYPGEVFYAQVDFVSEYDPGSSSGSNISWTITVPGFASAGAAQVGDSVGVFNSNIDSGVTTIKRFVASRLYLKTKDDEIYRLDGDTHFTTFKDPIEKIFGIELVNNVEAILGISTLTGNETIFGRVYGPKADDSTYGFEAKGRSGSATSFGNSNTNGSLSSVLYDYMKKYMRLDDSEIDISSFNDRLNLEKPFLDTTSFATKYFVFSNPTMTNFVFPESLSSPIGNVKNILTKFILPFNYQIYVNNDNKYSFTTITGSKNPIYTIKDSDFSLVSSETYNYLDIYGEIVGTSNFQEQTTELTENVKATTYATSSLARQVQENNLNLNLDGIGHSAQVVEDGNFIFSGFTLSSFVSSYANIFDRKVNIVNIRVSRRFYDIDIADVVSLESEILASTYANGENSKLMKVVGITNRLDDIELKLSDIIQINLDAFDITESPEKNASNSASQNTGQLA